MNELSSQVKTHVVVFHDDSVVFLSQRQFEALTTTTTNPLAKFFKIEGQTYAISSIKKILEYSEYVQQCPEEKRPVSYPRFDIDGMTRNFAPDRRLRAIESMIKGLKGYINSEGYQGTRGPYDILELMEKRRVEAVEDLKKKAERKHNAIYGGVNQNENNLPDSNLSSPEPETPKEDSLKPEYLPEPPLHSAEPDKTTVYPRNDGPTLPPYNSTPDSPHPDPPSWLAP